MQTHIGRLAQRLGLPRSTRLYQITERLRCRQCEKAPSRIEVGR